MRIRDGEKWIRDPEWKKLGYGIRDQHPGSATLQKSHLVIAVGTGPLQPTLIEQPAGQRQRSLVQLRLVSQQVLV